jgi:hypothetical protein
MGLKESEVGIIIHYFLEILYLGYVLERIDLYNCKSGMAIQARIPDIIRKEMCDIIIFEIQYE